jgi:OmpA-OmpF porin, OOP family
MCQPRKWWWGLLPLALLWMLANWQKAAPIAADLRLRAEAAGSAVAGSTPGVAPLAAAVAGRDVAVSGEVRAADLSPIALRAVDGEFGVRRVEGALKPALPQRPYSWAAQRDGAKLTLSGFVPDNTTKTALATAAAAAFAGAQVDDQQRIAFGAPTGFTAAAALGLAEIGKLSSGKAVLSDGNFCFEGAASTSDAFLDVLARVTSAPPGFARQACAITPPTITPYVWSAAKAATGAITLTGFYPSDAIRAEINTAVRAAASGGTVTDSMKPALGAPAALVGMVTEGMAQLSRMVEGTSSIAGSVYTIVGRGPASFEACDVLRRGLGGQLAQGFALGNAAIECPPPPAVLSWSAVKTAAGIVLSGMAPSAAAKAAAASSAQISTTGAVTDNVLVQGNIAAPPDYPAAVNFALGQLAQLSTGLASLDGPALVVTGEAPSAPAKAALDAVLAGSLPGGVRLARSQITLPPPPPPPVVVVPPPPPPPPPVVLVWSATKDGNGLTLSGVAPSAEARAAALAAARMATSGSVTDTMTVQGNLAVPPAYAPATDFALVQLGRLSSGQATLSGPTLSLRGVAPDPDTRRLIDAALGGALPGGLRSGEVSIVVRPYVMQAQSDRSGLVLTGYVPDEATRTDLVAAADTAGFAGKIRDELLVVSGAPADFGVAARTALSNLLRLDLGTARVDDQSLTLQGMTCRNVIRQEVETGSGSGLPAGFTGSGQVSVRQTGCTYCQLELDTATKGRNILFEQSSADLAADAETTAIIAEVARVLQVCPTARIAVEGHTDLDGERRGYPNKALSERRSQAVIDALVARGLAANRLMPVGFGPDRPLIPHGTAAAREQNRRVQFTIVNP